MHYQGSDRKHEISLARRPRQAYNGAMRGLMTFQQAAVSLLPLKRSARTLKRWASKDTPLKFRLMTVKRNGRTVGIRQQALDSWKARNET